MQDAEDEAGGSGAFAIEGVRIGDHDAFVLVDELAGSRATVVPSRGGLVTSLVARGREWLYLDSATFHDATQNVRGGIPVLFPSPGRLAGDRWSRGGQSGAMKQHGFARTRAFTEVGRGTDAGAWIEVELAADEASHTQYPWSFGLRIRFVLAGNGLLLHTRVENRGSDPMPFALGFHPYFAVPQSDKAATSIPTRAAHAWDNVARVERRLTGPIDLAAGEVDLHLLDHGARHAHLRCPHGTVTLTGDFDRWVVWTLPGRDFVCLEPWTSPADALNTGEDLIVLPAHAARDLVLRIDVTHREARTPH